MRNILTMLMAGGQGERLYPLTKTKAKPAVTFGGNYRIIDFTLSNCINSGIRRIYLLTQYSNASLDHHLQRGWTIFSHELGEFICNLPPQKMHMDSWYRGTADSIYQNLSLIEETRPERVLILSGDHIYKMNYQKLIEYHKEKGADVTLSCVALPLRECQQMGLMQVDDSFRVIGFQEKPRQPKALPADPTMALANMGVYVFKTEPLVRALIYNARHDNEHDFGKNIIPRMIKKDAVFAYTFQSEGKGEGNYWRDVGNLDAYYEAHQELLQPNPPLNPYETEWPIRTSQEQAPPVKIMSPPRKGRRKAQTTASVEDSLICNGSSLEGARVRRSVISPYVTVKPDSVVEGSILMKGVAIGKGARVRKAIIEEWIQVPPGYSIGYSEKEDRQRFAVTDSGIVVVPQGCILD